jgi:branched-chain amino acid aminotransferase
MLASSKIWMNGALVDWDAATVHVTAHGLHFGTGVFEGIRCYETPDGSAVFRVEDHLRRLENSARLLSIPLPYSRDELREAILELVAVNGLPESYIRPIAFYGAGELAVAPGANPVEVAIINWPWGTYLGEEAMKTGISAKISSWTRVGPNVIPHVAKATGVYLNSMLATVEAQRAGYREAIMLTDQGTVADGPGESLFIVKDGVVMTPPLNVSILQGITRDSVITIARELGHEVREVDLIRSELYLADEVFMTGTAAEVTPVRAVDDYEIGAGPVTLAIQAAYLDAVHGRGERYEAWLDRVPPPGQAAGG